MKRSWIHWIGKSFYTIDEFIAEATTVGVTRRASLRNIKNMEWSNVVVCTQRPKGMDKGSLVFLEFPITLLSGLSEEASDRIQKKFYTEKIDDGGDFVDRGCGSYEEGATYLTTAKLSDIADYLDLLARQGINIGRPMVGCRSNRIRVIHEPFPMLSDFSHRMGFQLFHRRRFWKVVRAQVIKDPKRRAVVKGKCRIFVSNLSSDDEGYIQEVRDYESLTRGDRYRSDKAKGKVTKWKDRRWAM